MRIRTRLYIFNFDCFHIFYIVNEKLITGTYILLDSSYSLPKIQFKSDGTIKGLKDYKSYIVWTDFVAPGPDEYVSDGICFDDANNNKPCFDFEFKSDTLILKQKKQIFKLLKQ